MDVWIIKETCLDRDYERVGVPLEADWTVIDIGAALGDFSVFAGQACPQGRVLAFEPFPPSFELLKHNLALNGLNNVEPRPVAVAARAQTQTLAVTGAAVQHRTVGQAETGTQTVTVEGTTLGHILDSLPDGGCDFLKLDCEGAEYDILMATTPEHLARIAHICLEVHDGVTIHSRQDLAGFLQRHGFDVRLAPNPVHANLGFLYAHRRAGPRPSSSDRR
jgi:FkbM family methyltransferase